MDPSVVSSTAFKSSLLVDKKMAGARHGPAEMIENAGQVCDFQGML